MFGLFKKKEKSGCCGANPVSCDSEKSADKAKESEGACCAEKAKEKAAKEDSCCGGGSCH